VLAQPPSAIRLATDRSSLVVGRYELHGALATGGMATVHLGRLIGEVGFARTVAIKRLHPQFATDPDFRSMLLEEARLASRVRHPNVVSVIDVVEAGNELLLIMEYVLGDSLSNIMRASMRASATVPHEVAVALAVNLLEGLHAAHEARDESGNSLGIVHRDVSPQNIVVGADGIARVLDFGIAKAAGSVHVTQEGQIKGKLAYMAPEQLKGMSSRRTDVYAAAVVLWEVLTGRKLFVGENDGQTLTRVVSEVVEPPSTYGAPASLDAVVLRGLSRDPAERFDTTRAMAAALTKAVPAAAPEVVAAWVERWAGATIEQRKDLIAKVETTASQLRSLNPSGIGSHSQGPGPVSGVEVPQEGIRARATLAGVAAASVLVNCTLFGGLWLYAHKTDSASATQGLAPVASPGLAPVASSGLAPVASLAPLADTRSVAITASATTQAVASAAPRSPSSTPLSSIPPKAPLQHAKTKTYGESYGDACHPFTECAAYSPLTNELRIHLNIPSCGSVHTAMRDSVCASSCERFVCNVQEARR
jgi:eukaryotic-like serine/threonine-protein kinase